MRFPSRISNLVPCLPLSTSVQNRLNFLTDTSAVAFVEVASVALRVYVVGEGRLALFALPDTLGIAIAVAGAIGHATSAAVASAPAVTAAGYAVACLNGASFKYRE